MKRRRTVVRPWGGLLRARDVAEYCSISRSMFAQLVATGRAPRPLRLGRCALWSRAALDRWIDAGLPPQHEEPA